MEDMENICRQYKKTRDPALKEKLILQYASLVRYVAGRLSMHVGQHVEYDDLMSYGIFGLIDAIDKFDADKGVKFETYATHRIRGSIIDSIRKLDWVPRTLRQKNRRLEDTYSALENELGRQPTDEELAEKLGVDIDEAREMIRKSSVVSLVSLDDYIEQNSDESFAGPAGDEDGPERQYELRETREMLADAIDKLTEKQKRVITLYYYEDLTLKEISSILNVSESRVSQIHASAVLRLQARLGKYKALLFSR